MFAPAQLPQHGPRVVFVARLAQNEAVALGHRVGRQHQGAASSGDIAVRLRAEPDDPARLRRSIANAVRGRVGVKPQRVLFALPQTISKTSSGKLMRRFVRSRYEAGEIG